MEPQEADEEEPDKQVFLLREELQEALCRYISDTFSYMDTVKEFCYKLSKWMLERETDVSMMMDIKDRADKINLNFSHVTKSENKAQALFELTKSKLSFNTDKRREELKKELANVLKNSLEGLEKLNSFLDAVERLAVTSLQVFMEENQVLELPREISPERVQAVITAARLVCPLLLLFKRDASAFFLPSIHNVEVLAASLDKYICIAQEICERLEKSAVSEFSEKMVKETVVDLTLDLSEDNIQAMLCHIRQLIDIREELQRELCHYISDTFSCIDALGEFFDTLSEWVKERKTEVTELNKIKDEADLNSVLEKALGGLEKLDPFLEAVERLAVTSLQVFMKNQVLQLPQEISLEKVQAVINDSTHVCPFLLEFKRHDRTFLRPNIKNADVFATQLDRYILITQIICHMMKKSSVNDLRQKRIEPEMVHLAVDLSEENIQNMLGHIRQLVSIRMDQHFRLVFLFQDVSCSEFIREYSERKPTILQFLSDLEETAVKLDEMKLGADISGVTSSSVGAVGGVLSIAGLILAPFTAGASLGLTLTGAGLGITGGVTSLVTTITESEVNRENQNKANEFFQTLLENMQNIQHFLEIASSQPVTRAGVGKSDVADTVVTGVRGSGEIAKDIISVVNDLQEPKPTLQSANEIEMVAQGAETTANEVQIANEFEMGAQGAEAIAQMPRVAADTGEAAARGVAALSSTARAGFGVLNGLFLGLDIYGITKNSISLHYGSKSEASEFIKARSALWCSELKAWQEIHDSLCQGLETSEKNKKILQKPFYPE
ncbi:uncharacterized protein LOC115363360 [Myripristis murdjan]|uniref:uncharacterized protein LOC115363360 n=1 Tax=Myripristis murdjan TaxID=586833 RepID=UPI001175F5C4|nr:uncharacterized protein LOC115363360 [Myripristis murdjan]